MQSIAGSTPRLPLKNTKPNQKSLLTRLLYKNLHSYGLKKESSYTTFFKLTYS